MPAAKPQSIADGFADRSENWLVIQRQLLVVFLFCVLFSPIVFVLYLKDRQQEWRLRVEQSAHRLDLAFELISKELERVQSDALILAEQVSVQQLAGGNVDLRPSVENEFRSFVNHKRNYDQVRLLNLSGKETVRVDVESSRARIVPASELQDKGDRYYVQESRQLPAGDVFVSEFDLNQEHGSLERPLKPVIRFVTPVTDSGGEKCGLLVLNYLGRPLLSELQLISLPGHTLLLRNDGNFLLSTNVEDEWGWLLGNTQSFANRFPRSWPLIENADGSCFLADQGAFAARSVQLSAIGNRNALSQSPGELISLLIVSYLPAEQVFPVSNHLFGRLLLLAGLMVFPLFFMTRFWAVASVRRHQQGVRIRQSEERLRELSSRLLRIQEEERKAISREIHDGLGQQVTAINLDLKLAERDSQSETSKTQLRRAIKENEQLLSSLHDFAIRVRPSVLDDLGLQDAIESHLWEFEQRTGMQVEFEGSVQNVEFQSVVAENVFRLLQESLTNVSKHSGAQQVIVKIEIDKSGTQPVLQLVVSDDGVGKTNLKLDGSRLGILGMQERVDLLQGKLQIDSQENAGTVVKVRIPLDFNSPKPAL